MRGIPRHILILHQRKQENKKTLIILILICLTLCFFTTLCVLFNDWTLLPQAYNPMPLVFGEPLFELSPCLKPKRINMEQLRKQKVENLTEKHDNRIRKLNEIHSQIIFAKGD